MLAMHRPALTKRRLFQLGFAEQPNFGISYFIGGFHERQKGQPARKVVNVALMGGSRSGKSRFIRSLNTCITKESKEFPSENPSQSSTMLTGVYEKNGIYFIFSELSVSTAEMWMAESRTSKTQGLISTSCCTRFDAVMLIFDDAHDDSFLETMRLEQQLSPTFPRFYVVARSMRGNSGLTPVNIDE